MPNEELTSPIAKELLKDVERDIRDVQREYDAKLEELYELRAFLQQHIETRRSVTLEEVRDWFTDCTGPGMEPASLDEVAAGLGCSSGQLRAKGYIDKLLTQGTIMKVVLDTAGSPVRYQFNYFDHKQIRAGKYKKGERPKLRLVATRAVAGTSGKPRRARKTLIRRHRKGHR
jgi:hypothetical protein